MTTTTHSGTATRRFYKYCGTCKTVVDLTDGPSVCPGCESPQSLAPTPGNLELQARLYGTTAVPKWNEGLGAWTAGKSDRRAIARSKKLIPADE